MPPEYVWSVRPSALRTASQPVRGDPRYRTVGSDHDGVGSVGSKLFEKALNLGVRLLRGPVPALGAEAMDKELPAVQNLLRDGDPTIIVPQRVAPADTSQRLAG